MDSDDNEGAVVINMLLGKEQWNSLVLILADQIHD